MPNTTITGASNFVLQELLGSVTDEAYTDAKKLSGTSLVSGNPDIKPDGETYIGQMRWYQPLNPVINVASISDATKGSLTDVQQAYLTYVKTARTHGSGRVNLSRLITQQDKLDKIGRDYGHTRALDEHNCLQAVLKGVAVSELCYGVGQASGHASGGLGGQNFDNDPESLRNGFYVDLQANKLVTAAAAGNLGAARATNLLTAFSMGFKDYEPDYAYLIVSPQTMSDIRSANLVDSTKVVDGNIEFTTIFDGKFRLIVTRASQGLTAAEVTKMNLSGTAADLVGAKCSYIVLPGALCFVPINVEEDFGIQKDEGSYKGGGNTEIWYRWAHIVHPAGYDWKGSKDEFASNDSYAYVNELVAAAQVPKGLLTATDMTKVSGIWQRKAKSVLTLGIMPIFHG